MKRPPRCHAAGGQHPCGGCHPRPGRPVNARLRLMPYAAARRTPALRPWMDLANCLASLTNRWGRPAARGICPGAAGLARPDDCGPPQPELCRCGCRPMGLPLPGWPTAIWPCCVPRPGPGAARWWGCNLAGTDRRRCTGAPLCRRARLCVHRRQPESAALRPWASENDFDCETDMPLDDFMVAWGQPGPADAPAQKQYLTAGPHPVQRMAAPSGHRCPRRLPYVHQRRGAPAGR